MGGCWGIEAGQEGSGADGPSASLDDSLVNWLQLLHAVTVELELQGTSLKGFVVWLCCCFIVAFFHR